MPVLPSITGGPLCKISLAAALLLTLTAAGTTHHRAAPAADPAPTITGQNPLLPAQVDAAALIPELGLLQKNPNIAPAGFEPIYSQADWDSYRSRFGTEADSIGGKKASAQLELAQRMLTAAGEVPDRKSLTRLVCLRVVALAYRVKDGSPVVASALANYQSAMDGESPAQVAGLWQMTDIVARYSVTPRDLRPKYSLLAARANVQLAMILLDGGQVQAAAAIIRMLGRHEPALKQDPAFKSQAASARALIGQTAVLMDEMAQQLAAYKTGDQDAPMKLYLFGRFAARRPMPDLAGVSPEFIVGKILEQHPDSAAAAIENAIQKSRDNPLSAFDAAEMLKSAAAGLPDGLLRHRVLNGAKEEYAAFLRSRETQDERIKRTLARIALEAVVSDGATGNPHIRPLTQPLPNPATRAATPAH